MSAYTRPKPLTLTKVPTHSELTDFMFTLLPPHARDVPPIYHEPRYPSYNPSTTRIHDVVLSITPTTGVYTKLSQLASIDRYRKPACFLHRPFNLDRRTVPRGTIIHASHKRFDELLTTGWNVALAWKLGLEIDTAVCIQGYKGDPERRIGLVARLSQPCTLNDIHTSVLGEFTTAEVFPKEAEIHAESRIDSIAIMNAFGADEVTRAVTAAVNAGFIADSANARLLYLTGEPKELGVTALRETYSGMVALCVGHREAEEWGIKYVGACVKQKWEDVGIHMIFEDEEPIHRSNDISQKAKPKQTEGPAAA